MCHRVSRLLNMLAPPLLCLLLPTANPIGKPIRHSTMKHNPAAAAAVGSADNAGLVSVSPCLPCCTGKCLAGHGTGTRDAFRQNTLGTPFAPVLGEARGKANYAQQARARLVGLDLCTFSVLRFRINSSDEMSRACCRGGSGGEGECVQWKFISG